MLNIRKVRPLIFLWQVQLVNFRGTYNSEEHDEEGTTPNLIPAGAMGCCHTEGAAVDQSRLEAATCIGDRACHDSASSSSLGRHDRDLIPAGAMS